MRKLLLLRHAKGVPAETAPDDFERPLNAKGLTAARAVAHYLSVTKLKPDLVLCSAALRTRGTLAELLPVLAHDCRIAIEHRLYMASAPRLLERVRNIDEDVNCALVIGHNPGLERLARMLAGSGPADMIDSLRAKFPGAALAILEFEGARWRAVDKDGGRLSQFVCPRDLED
jgi:phosphohistidine phosphatase